MAITSFPPVKSADESGLVAIGGDLEISSLLLAYGKGIFPWPISNEFPLAWFSPDPRGVMDFSELKVSRRLQRYLKNLNLEISTNTNFESVIMNCAQIKRKGQAGTWITKEIIDGYIDLHRAGFAYSIEGLLNGKLVAGLYGVVVRGCVSGESMFTFEPNASKGVFLALMHLLQKAGIHWLDTQMVTPVISGLGGKEIPRKDFLQRLSRAPAISAYEIFGKPGEKKIFLS